MYLNLFSSTNLSFQSGKQFCVDMIITQKMARKWQMLLPIALEPKNYLVCSTDFSTFYTGEEDVWNLLSWSQQMFELYLAYKRFDLWDVLTVHFRYPNGDYEISLCMRFDKWRALNEPQMA